jgi:hypothetical protein
MLGTRMLPANLFQRIMGRAIGIPAAGSLHGDPSQAASVRSGIIEREHLA